MRPPSQKCARCGHPKGKHSTGPRGGCGMRKWVNGAFGARPNKGRLISCDCPGYMELER